VTRHPAPRPGPADRRRQPGIERTITCLYEGTVTALQWHPGEIQVGRDLDNLRWHLTVHGSTDRSGDHIMLTLDPDAAALLWGALAPAGDQEPGPATSGSPGTGHTIACHYVAMVNTLLPASDVIRVRRRDSGWWDLWVAARRGWHLEVRHGGWFRWFRTPVVPIYGNVGPDPLGLMLDPQAAAELWRALEPTGGDFGWVADDRGVR
jgi:hypothetical protein